MNGSSPLVYDLNDFSEYVDLNRFQYCFCSVSGGMLAIATDTSLILTDDVSNGQFRSEDSPSSGTRLVLEFNEEAGRATSIQWVLQGEVVAVGFESGLLVCFNCKGEEVFEFKGTGSAVQSLKVASTELHKTGPSLWILYEDGHLITFPVARVFDHKEEALMSYRLSNQQNLNDFVFFPALYKASIFDLDDTPVNSSTAAKTNTTGSATKARPKTPSPVPAFITTAPTVSVFTVGKESAMGLYNLGGVVLNPENDKNTSVRESAVNLLSKYFFGTSDTTSANTTERKPDSVRVQDCTVSVAARLEFKDAKRRVLKLSADPTGSLIAASDILGRVTLFDCNICAVVRIWKGLRHAELAWTSRRAAKASTATSGSNHSGSAGNLEGLDRSQVLTSGLPESPAGVQIANLVIHAPLLGLVYIYSMPHGPCVRIIPVGLNCHVFSLNLPAPDSNFRMGNVRAYLLKPLVDRCSIELTEIRPADQEATDLDVRLTLVGTDDDFIIGDDGLDDGEGDAEGHFGASRDLSDDFLQGQGLFLDAPGDAAEADEARRRRPSLARRPSNAGPASTAATEQCALRNIEQSLQILCDAMPMAAMRAAAALAGTGQSVPPIAAPVSKDIFDIAVERAEESLLETLAAHRSVLGLTSLYKCFTMVECVELFGELSAPPPVAPDAASGAPLDLVALSNALAPYTAVVHSAQQCGTPLAKQNSGSLKLTRGSSNTSLLSLTSDNSYATAAPGSPYISTAAGGKRLSNACNLAAGLMRYPAFSAHLHKTLLAMLDDAIKSHDSAGKGKFHFDVSRGEITHLPAPVLQRLSKELPLRQKCLAAYAIFVEIGAAADRVKEESSRTNVGFSALQALNLRQLFERTTSITGAGPAPPPSGQSVLSGSIFNSMSLSSSPSGVFSAGVAAGPQAAPVHRPLNDDIANLCKLNTVRAEAAMWALRAAQNIEIEQARLAATLPSPASASACAENERLSSADSGNSGSSHSMFRSSLQNASAVGVRRSLTPSASLENVHGNSHSKVTRISAAGRDTLDTPPATPALSTERTDSAASSLFPFFPTEYSKRGAGGSFKPGSSRGGSSTGSGTGSEGRVLIDSTAELDFSSVSFSVFRAFHLALEAAAKMDREWTHDRELCDSLHDSLEGDANAGPKLRTTQLLKYVLQMDDHLHQGRLTQAFDLINSAAPLIVTAGPGSMNRTHSASNLSLNLSALRSPGSSHSAGPASPRQGFPVSIHSMHSMLPALTVPTSSAGAASNSEATGTIAAAIMRALTSSEMRIETTFAVGASTAVATVRGGGGGGGNTKAPPAEFTLLWTPSLVSPHALSSFLAAPLTGDIFSLNSFTDALKLMGLPNKLTGLKHLAPLFCSHLAKQTAQYLVTDVLTKKLSTFPFQRWLRDSLLTFQDALSSMEQQRTAHANRTPSIAIPATSVTSTDSVRTSLLGRPPVSTSAERDAHDVSQMLSRIQTDSGDKASKLRAPGGSGSYDEAGAAEDVSEDMDTIMQLAEEIHHSRGRSSSSGGADGAEDGAVPEARRRLFSDQASFLSSAEPLPSYNEYIRHILRPAWLYAAQCSNLEAVLTFCALVLEALHVVHDQVERRTYGAQSLQGTIGAWENLVRQTRVVLLLRSRVGTGGASSGSTGDVMSPGGEGSHPATGAHGVHSAHPAEFTVRNLSHGAVSLHRLLAADTLGFALRAEQALEHEDKCREVYARSSYHNRKLGSSHSTMSVTGAGGSVSAGSSPDTYVVRSPSGVPSSNHAKAEVLLAWGAVADKRWKDLLSVAVAEDAISATLRGEREGSVTIGAVPSGATDKSGAKGTAHAASTPPQMSAAEQAKRLEQQKQSVRRRRPLLLYFPLHSQPHMLGGYRSIILAERWSKAIHRVDLLVSASQHLFSLPHMTWRPAVASYIYMTHIFPVFELFVALEENPQLLAIASAGGSVVGAGAVVSQGEAGVGGDQTLASKVHSKQTQQLMRLVTDMRLLKAFANTAAELLGFIETALHLLRASPSASAPSAGTAAGNSGHAGGPAGGTSGYADAGAGRLGALWQHSDVRGALQSMREHTQRGAFQDEDLQHTWPGQEDPFLSLLLIQYATQVAGPQPGGLQAAAARSVGDKKVAQSNSSGGAVAAAGQQAGVLWTESVVGELIGMLWVMHLRSLCALRGLRPSEVLGASVLERLHSLQQQYLCASGAARQITQSAPPSSAVRMEFATQCLRQLVHSRQPTGAVYVLVMRWLSCMQLQGSVGGAGTSQGMAADSSTLTMEAVRLRHLGILLAAGGGSRDEEAEQMVPQIADMDVVLDTLIEALRRRLGLILSRIDQLPSFGPLIAAMDAEAVAWARNAISKEEYLALLNSGVSADVGLGGGAGGAAAGHNGSNLVSDLAGVCKSLNINIASTRHLVICVQSNLLNIPVHLRSATTNIPAEMPNWSDSSAKTSWFERKTRCDALLTLCKYFAQQFAHKH